MEDENLSATPVRHNWQGAWIWPAPICEGRNIYALFRRSFATAQKMRLEVKITFDEDRPGGHALVRPLALSDAFCRRYAGGSPAPDAASVGGLQRSADLS